MSELHNRWRMGFHLMPPTGWMNDPNGLCRFRGVYHVFHQYSPAWPEPDAPRGWGHATSRDLVHWEHEGMVIAPDTPADATGAYSGSALVLRGAAADGGDLLRLYYTGNVKEPGEHDYVHSGRQANEILIESEDGYALGRKRVLLRNADYPASCTCHVRDPKVWEQDGSYWMLLGARDADDCGLALLYRSADGIAWESAGSLRSSAAFGFMWECPDRIALDGAEYLAWCPQGVERLSWANGIRDQAGYAPLAPGERVCDAPGVDAARFARWDAGFDFYAPQTLTDEDGRVLLLGWMGLPVAPFESAPQGMSWIHCLTVPRELSRAEDGAILQVPARELTGLRGGCAELERGVPETLAGRRADIEIAGIEGALRLELDGGLRVELADGLLTLAFAEAERGLDGMGAGRTVRSCPLAAPATLRVLVDGSAVEVYANGGRAVMASRWFPRAERLTIRYEGTCASACAWEMGDGMAATYRDGGR